MFGKQRKLEKRLRKLGVDYSDSEKRYTIHLPEGQEPEQDYLKDVVDTIASHALKRSASETKPILVGGKSPFYLAGIWGMDMDIQVEGGSPSYITQCIGDRKSELDEKLCAEDTPDNALCGIADAYGLMKSTLSLKYGREPRYMQTHTIEPIVDNDGNRVGEQEWI